MSASDQRPMSLFADYRPGESRAAPADLELVRAEARDVPALAEMTARREGRDPAEFEPRFRREIELDEDTHGLWVARTGGQTVAFARCGWIAQAADAQPNHEPEGWYLVGVIVAEPWRRRGIGRALTELRLDVLSQRAEEVFYIANLLNQASIDLHTRLGFEELTRDFHSPGIQFKGGRGALFRLDLARWRERRAGG